MEEIEGIIPRNIKPKAIWVKINMIKKAYNYTRMA